VPRTIPARRPPGLANYWHPIATSGEVGAIDGPAIKPYAVEAAEAGLAYAYDDGGYRREYP
jgi:hypothetical protein